MPLLPLLLAAALLMLARPAWAEIAADVQALLGKGDLVAALQRVEGALSSQPRDAQNRFMHAVVLMEMRRDDEAFQGFTRLSQEYPELPEPFNNIALLHARAGRYELARQALEAALRNDPGHRAARANLGEVHLVLAVQAWDAAAALGPLDARLARKLELARALVGSGALAAR